ncbi:uncharacterized protein LOC111901725 isoform X2 [Lactuca sativa]|uniref:uncharacterized protein LOC111901725 isoform X2 n=1 Tax=Lactuca sativa TaxID=4236 RepID=UPI000CBFF321|nr:uncharacterized protein LOC111901725 isoform X2 [Lactuca sativa]
MFKSGRWKAQNSKIKVMFQLQFQATQVPKVKGKGLMISLIPGDIGKPTAKLEKAPVVEGTCTWEDPIYEMVKLVKHQKTETYKEKIYFFNVQTGSSKSGFIGEVGVDFANFAEATEPLQLSLPLTASDSGAILHVFIQKMQRTDEQRESEENESLKSESLRLKNQLSDSSENGNILDFAEDTTVSRNSKPVNKKVEKHQKQRSSTDWSMGSLSDRSMADLINSPEHNNSNNNNQIQNNEDQRLYAEASRNAVEVLKSNVSRLERQVEMSDLELESLRKQIHKENKRGQDLLKKVTELQEEKEALEEEKKKDIATMKELYGELEVEKREKEGLKVHVDDITLDYKFLLQENEDMSLKLENVENEYSKSLTMVKQYEIQVKRLEEKVMNQALEISQSFDTISEYETHIKGLEKELEKQGRDFEDDVEDLMKSKLEADEDLRNARLENQSLKQQMREMQEAVENSNVELSLMKSTHKKEVEKLCDQMNMQEEQIKEMSLELEKVGEREVMVMEFGSLKMETEKLQKESTNWTSLMSEKNVMIRTLQSELKMLRGDYNELQERLLGIESEKVNLRKEVSKLEHNLRKKEDQPKHLKLFQESKVDCDVSTSKQDEQKINKLLSEISSLDEKNKHMESELKEMQEKYTEISLRFAEVEGERQQLVMTLRNIRNGKKK